MSINDSLNQALSSERIWIYTDGSASTHGHKTGSYAAVIIPGVGKPAQVVVGSCSSAKTGRMEISAVNHALYHVRAVTLDNIILDEQEIQIITDSEYVVLGATDPSSRKANKDLWAQFDELSKGLKISINHMGRNQEPPQALADALCHQTRKRLEAFLDALNLMPEFVSMGISRTTKINDEP